MSGMMINPCSRDTYSPAEEYHDGLTQGFIDGCIVDEPVNTGQHTYERFISSHSLYTSAIFNPNPSPSQLGYSRGFDLAAIYTSASRGERWQDRGEED